MDENYDVTRVGECLDLSIHRSCNISRCENGYVVKYQAVRKKQSDDDWHGNMKSETRVFTNNADLFEWLQTYFQGSPGV